MRTIAHISDLHFGRIDPPVAAGLAAELAAQKPDLLVVSGDLTQRARPGQYAEAAAYLRTLPSPQIVVPGNHDIPLWNIFRRFVDPLRQYRRHIAEDLFPIFQDDEIFVAGINTARSFTRTSGWISPEQLAELRERMASLPPDLFRVVVTHHPFIPSPRDARGDILRNPVAALQTLESLGVDLLLAGHLHLAYHDDVRIFHGGGGKPMISVQAGTAASTRRRGEPNAYNRIEIHPGLIVISVRVWTGREFEESLVTRYRRVSQRWEREAAADPSPSSLQASA